MFTNNPVQSYQQNYNPFGINLGSVLWTTPEELPSGLIPNLNSPISASALQKGTPFISEIEMQNGVIYTGVSSFPVNITDALQSQESGYRLGLDSRDNNIAKFYIGGNRNFFFWDGTNISMSGQLHLYGISDAINFYDQNGSPEGQIYANSSQLIINGGLELSLEVNNVDCMDFTTDGGGQITANVPFVLANLAADPSLLDSTNGMLYYNTTTNNVRAFVAGAWVTVV